MGKCLIFCAGGFDGLWEEIQPGDYLLAADGGLTHLEKLNLTPHGIIGDFDSLGYVPEVTRAHTAIGSDIEAKIRLPLQTKKKE